MKCPLGKIDQQTVKGRLSLPHQSQKSKTHLSEMSLLEHKMLMCMETRVREFWSIGHRMSSTECGHLHYQGQTYIHLTAHNCLQYKSTCCNKVLRNYELQ